MSSVIEDDPGEPIGALETGLWCKRCLLPSAIKWPAVDAYGNIVPLIYYIICFDCNAYLDDDGSVLDEDAG